MPSKQYLNYQKKIRPNKIFYSIVGMVRQPMVSAGIWASDPVISSLMPWPLSNIATLFLRSKFNYIYLFIWQAFELTYTQQKAHVKRVKTHSLSAHTIQDGKNLTKKWYRISHDYEAPWNKCGIFWEKGCLVVWIIGVFYVQKMKRIWGNNLLVFLSGKWKKAR